MSKSLWSLTNNEWCEQVAQDAHQKWVNRSFFEANRSFFSKALFFLANCSLSHYLLIFWKKLPICSKNWWANSQPWSNSNKNWKLKKNNLWWSYLTLIFVKETIYFYFFAQMACKFAWFANIYKLHVAQNIKVMHSKIC